MAQDRLREMPGYEQYTKMQPLLSGAVVSGALNVTWTNDGKSFTYNHGGKAYQFDLATMKPTVTGDAPRRQPAQAAAAAAHHRCPLARDGASKRRPRLRRRAARGGMQQAQFEMPEAPMEGCPSGAAARGRQAFCVASPDNKLKAFYRKRNLWVANFDGSGEKAITTDGSEKERTKYGTGSWVYGEELSQTTAIWWSPDSTRVGFYRFDESQVKDFYLQMNQTQVQGTVDIEAYPKPGAPNPIADVFVYDTKAGKDVKMDVRDGKPFTNDVVGHYVYNIRWSPGRHRALPEPDQPAAADHGVHGLQPGDRHRPRHHPRGVADRVDRQPSVDAVPQGQPPLHLGVGAERLAQLLSVRSQRQAAGHPHQPHDLRGRQHRQDRRDGRSHVLHGARRRQLHEDAAPPRRPRRQGGCAADRSQVHAQRRQLHAGRGRRPRRRRRPGRRAPAVAAAAASLRTTSSSSMSTRPTISLPPHSCSTPTARS